MSLSSLTTPVAIVVAALLIAIGLSASTPRYEVIAISNSANPAVWKFDRFNGDVFLCATAGSKEAESGCSVKLKQF